MRAQRFKCRHCQRLVTLGKPGQKYCGQKACQAARKREWSRKKYASDSDYRINQKESTAAWLETQGGAAEYYRDYRRRRRRRKLEVQEAGAPAVVSGTCEGTLKDARGEGQYKARECPVTSLFAPGVSDLGASANRDACLQYSQIISGIYEISRIGANKDAEIVKIRMISSG